MSTNGAFGFRINGQDKIAFNHFDSYPGALGVDILSDIQEYMTAFSSYEAMLQDLQCRVNALRVVQHEDQPPDEDFARYRKYVQEPASPEDHVWRSLMDDAPNTMKVYLSGKRDVVIDSHLFMLDSLHCEWAYVLNVDAAQLEVYRGFNERRRKNCGRYAALSHPRRGENPSHFGVTFVTSFPLVGIYDGSVTLNTMSRQQQFANQRGMFNSAWMLAQQGAKRFGGKPSDYWIAALKEVQ